MVRIAPAHALTLALALGGPSAMLVLMPPPAAAQVTGTLSGPRFVEAAGVYSRFQVEAGAIALRNSSNEAVHELATKMLAEFERVSASLRVAAESAEGNIDPPTRLNGEYEVWLERLRAAKGAEFDALYVQIQTEAARDAKVVFSSYAELGDQSTLKGFAEETLPVLDRYAEEVSKLQIRS